MTILDLGTFQFALFSLYFARISAFFFVAPLFSGRNVPAVFKITLSFFLALLFFVVNRPELHPELLEMSNYVPAMMTELAVGALLGFFVGLIFVAFYVAGEHIGYQMGFAVVNVFDFATQQQTSLIAEFLFTLSMLVFLNLNLHHGLIYIWHDSLVLAPPGQVDMGLWSLADLGRVCTDMFIIAFQLAAPLMAFLILTDISLGILARIMPQMNVFFVGLPIKIAFGLFMLSAAVMTYGVLTERASRTIFQDTLRFITG
jgi:flagellar biosynthetic protein FliR